MSYSRPGFILFFGTRPISSSDPSAAAIDTICPNCHHHSRIIGKTCRNWFTLFFIPMFPVSGTKTFSQCTHCGAQFPVPISELASNIRQADQQQMRRSIAMYNSLRNSPANSVTLNDLMALYASIGEFDQAVSAAGEFAQALNNSEQCMTTLGRIYLAKNQFDEALKWLEAAIARNPDLGEAHYYRAIACLTQPALDLDKAIRSARAAGYPGAEDLLQEAQRRASPS